MLGLTYPGRRGSRNNNNATRLPRAIVCHAFSVELPTASRNGNGNDKRIPSLALQAPKQLQPQPQPRAAVLQKTTDTLDLRLGLANSHDREHDHIRSIDAEHMPSGPRRKLWSGRMGMP